METKQVIRKEIFKRRKEAETTQIVEDSHAIFLALQSLPKFQQAEGIYLYIDCKNEVQTGEIMDEALRLGKRVAAPRVEGQEMVFYEIFSRDDLAPGYFGILEPKDGLPEAIAEEGLLLMPGVAFDKDCHRIGYGGGFYDRYLQKHSGFYKVAVAFEFQMFAEVPTEPTDIVPDLLITEKTYYT